MSENKNVVTYLFVNESFACKNITLSCMNEFQINNN